MRDVVRIRRAQQQQGYDLGVAHRCGLRARGLPKVSSPALHLSYKVPPQQGQGRRRIRKAFLQAAVMQNARSPSKASKSGVSPTSSCALGSASYTVREPPLLTTAPQHQPSKPTGKGPGSCSNQSGDLLHNAKPLCRYSCFAKKHTARLKIAFLCRRQQLACQVIATLQRHVRQCSRKLYQLSVGMFLLLQVSGATLRVARDVLDTAASASVPSLANPDRSV